MCTFNDHSTIIWQCTCECCCLHHPTHDSIDAQQPGMHCYDALLLARRREATIAVISAMLCTSFVP